MSKIKCEIKLFCRYNSVSRYDCETERLVSHKMFSTTHHCGRAAQAEGEHVAKVHPVPDHTAQVETLTKSAHVTELFQSHLFKRGAVAHHRI